MLKKIFGVLKFSYVTLPVKGLLSSLGYKQLKQSLEVNKAQFKQLRNPICPLCYKNIVLYETSPIDILEAKKNNLSADTVMVHLNCANPECLLDVNFYSSSSKKIIKGNMEKQIQKIGESKRDQILKNLTPEFVNQKINDHYQQAIMFKWLAIVCFIASLITFGMYGVLAFIAWLVFGLGIILLSLKSAFRSWQAQTFNVYQSASLFMYWFKNIHWYQKPKFVPVKK